MLLLTVGQCSQSGASWVTQLATQYRRVCVCFCDRQLGCSVTRHVRGVQHARKFSVFAGHDFLKMSRSFFAAFGAGTWLERKPVGKSNGGQRRVFCRRKTRRHQQCTGPHTVQDADVSPLRGHPASMAGCVRQAAAMPWVDHCGGRVHKHALPACQAAEHTRVPNHPGAAKRQSSWGVVWGPRPRQHCEICQAARIPTTRITHGIDQADRTQQIRRKTNMTQPQTVKS